MNFSPRLSLGILALLAAASCAGSAAASTWSAVATLSGTGTVYSPRVVVDSTGVSTAVWPFAPNGSGGAYEIRAARKAGLASWTATATVSSGTPSTSVDLAVDATGVVTAVWQRYTGSSYTVESNRYTGSGWAGVETIASGFATSVDNLRVAADAGGTVMAVWSRTASGAVIAEASRRTASGWDAQPTNIAQGDYNSSEPAIAADGAGGFTVVWLRWPTAGATKRIAARTFTSSQWGTTEDISIPVNGQGGPQISANAAGVMAATWWRSNGSNQIIQARHRVSGTWGTTYDLSATGRNALEPQIAVDPAGGATATWYRSDGSNNIVQASRAASSSSGWGPAESLSQAGQNAGSPDVAVDPAGEATVIWYRGSSPVIQAASTVGGVWGAASSITAAGFMGSPRPQIAAAPDGSTTAAWDRTPGFTYTEASTGTNPPAGPTSVTATPATGGATVSWTAPVVTGGAAVTSYTATASPGGASCVATAPATTCPISGLTGGTGYTFTVTATNSVGTGAPSSASATVTALSEPGAPSGVSATPGDASATVQWTAPANTGGSAILGYTATASPGGTTCTATAPATTCTVSGLDNGTAYTFTVTARNAVGTGAASSPSTPVTPEATPATPASPPAAQGTTPSSAEVPPKTDTATPQPPRMLIGPAELAEGIPVASDGSFAVRVACPARATCRVGGTVGSPASSTPPSRLSSATVRGGSARLVTLSMSRRELLALNRARVKVAGATLRMTARAPGSVRTQSQRARLRIPQLRLAVTG